MKIEERNIFSFAGIVQNPGAYVGAIALCDYFWVLKPDLRIKLLKSWIRVLENCADKEFLKEAAPEYAEGESIIFVDSDVLESIDIPNNVIPFRRKYVERLEKKTDEC